MNHQIAPSPTPPAVLPADRLIQIIHFQTEMAKTGLDLAHVMELTASLAQLLTGADGATVEVVEDSDMIYRATAGTAKKHQGVRISQKSSLSGLCVASGKAFCCADSDTDPRVSIETCRTMCLTSMLVVPLLHESSTIGVLKVLSARPHAFGDDDIQTLTLLSTVIAATLIYAGEHSTKTEEARSLYIRATQDSLTGLGNRALFDDRLRQLIALAQRANEHLGLIILDMDDLKQINDTYGHLAGDQALRTLGKRLQTAIRASDVAVRLGGDEFALILPAVHDRDTAQRTAAMISERLQGTFTFDGCEHPLCTSLGLAVFPENGSDAESLFKFADDAMYKAKRARRTAR